MRSIRQDVIRRMRSNMPLFVGVVGLLVGADPARSAQKPNIVFILADDLGYADVGCYGQLQRQSQGLPAIDTPQIDLLAQQGIRFTQCYSGHTVCAPARCSLMTGYHTGHTRVRGNFAPGSVRIPLQASDVTVAELLKPAGYYNGIIGKWGLGDETPELVSGVPNLQGFDYFYGFLDQADAHDHTPDYLWENRNQVYVGGQYANDLFTAKALTFLDQHAGGPFFLYMAYTLPHGPLEVPDYGPYANKPWTADEKAYAAMVNRMDGGIGQILTRLNDLGVDDNTIVFFASDNGPTANITLFDSNGPLRGYKTEYYDGGIRVPMIARWPNIIPAGAVSTESWAFWDVMPTLAELAGVSAPAGIDGISAVAALVGQPQQSRDHLYWEDPFGDIEQAVRLGDFKAVRKLTQYFELYNLASDIGETTNIINQYPLVQAHMEQVMVADRTESDDWYIGPFCGGGPSLDGVTLVTYTGWNSAPICGAMTAAQQQASVYTDTSSPIIAGGLPAAYQGGVLVQTAYNDTTDTSSEFIKLFMAHDATVAVGYRTNAVKPSWWTSNYAATGNTITINLFGSNRTFDVRTRDMPAAGVLSIPGNRNGGGNGDAEYIVIVQKKTTTTTPPTIAMQPQSQTIKIASSGTFSLVGCGTAPLTYRWDKMNATGVWNPISGATALSYVIPSVGSPDAGTYRCVVSNAFGSVTSNSAVLTVVPQLTPLSASAGHWAFDESGGNIAIDSSGNGRDGTLNGPTRTSTCILGSALNFDGINDQVLVDWEGITAAQARSVCFWVKTSDLNGHAMVAWGDDQVAGGKWHIIINADPARGVVGAVGTEVGGGYSVGTMNIADDHLHHVAVVFTGPDVADMVYYIDGQPDGVSGSQSQAVNTVSNGRIVTIGARPVGGSTEYFAGLLDEVRIYSSAISSQTIDTLIDALPTFKMDFDGDCDVDQTDFAHLQACYTQVGILPGCADADFNADIAVGSIDFNRFLPCMKGANIAPDPNCAN